MNNHEFLYHINLIYRYMIRVGHIDLNESVKDNASSQDILVESIIIHENYSQSPVINDIALIKLKHAAKISCKFF